VEDANGQPVTRRLRFRDDGVGRMLMGGLPTGTAKITARRAVGKKGKAVLVRVLPDRTTRVQVHVP